MGDLEALGSLLKQYGTGEIDPTDQDELLRMLELPVTDELRARLGALEQAMGALPDDASVLLRQRLGGEIERQKRQLARAEQRDRINQRRPDNCWCLGLGGRGRVGIAPQIGDIDEADVVSWREYCPCPDGQAAQARARAVTERVKHLHQAARLARLWESVPPKLRDYSLETYLRAGITANQRAQAERLSLWLPTDRWLLLYGPVGRGKSGLAVALLRELINQGQTGVFVTVPELLGRLRSTYGQKAGVAREQGWSEDAVKAETEAQVLASLAEAQVLVLDDIGKENPSDWTRATLFRLIDGRYTHGLRTMLTSNLDPYELVKTKRVDLAVMDRIRELATPWVLQLDGKNLREQAA